MNAPLFVTLSAVGALAQDTAAVSSDDTGRTITLVIGALLGLALLLAVLTFWYWRRTDPRKAPGTVQVSVPMTAADRPRPAPAKATPNGPAATRPAGASSRSGSGEGTAADRGITNEEWLRLTGSRQSGARDRT